MSDKFYTICKSYDYSDYYRNYFSLSDTDNLTIKILSPIALIFCALNITFFIKIPNSRQPPFDVLLFLSVFSVMTITIYITTVVYNSYNPINIHSPLDIPADFSSFCLATGTLNFCAKAGIFIYNLIFCFYYTFKIKNPLKSWAKENNQVHFLCWLITIVLTVVLYLANQIGVGAFGLCGLKVSAASFFIEIGIDAIFIGILGLTSVIFLKYLRKLSKFDSKASIFFKYYLIYTIVLSLNFLIQSLAITFIVIDCFIGLQQYDRKTLSTLINIFNLLLPITVSLIIWFHPEARKNIYITIYKAFKKQQKQSIRQSYYDDISNDNAEKTYKDPILVQLQELNRFGNGLISGMKQRNRVSLLSTILGCITIQSRQLDEYGKMINRSSMGSHQQQHIFSWNMKDRYQIQVGQALVRSQPQCFVQHIPCVDMKFISYSASTFQYLMALDEVKNLEVSTNPNNNLNSIYSNAQGDGGSSGQFFFFTSDSRLILKTVTKKQLNVLLNRLGNYYQHFKTNNQSLIVKIYGLFTSINSETQQQIHLMLMGNLCGQIPRKFVSRVYDMKGSTHSRQVYPIQFIKQMKQQELSKKTMKDVDFDMLQGYINVPRITSNKVKQILKNDSRFFQGNGLIDYSLIVIKVNYGAYLKQIDYKNPYFQERTMFHSQTEENMIYIFGIIDYLQTWNVKKKSQRWYKSIWNKSESISSQSPTYYSQRFCSNMIDKIFK